MAWDVLSRDVLSYIQCIYWLVPTKSLDGMGVQADPFVAYNKIMNFAVTSLLDL